MNKLKLSINGGIGDNLLIRIFFDSIKDNYNQIEVSHDKWVIEHYKDGDPKYYNFLNELGNLLFSTPPYSFTHTNMFELPGINLYKISQELNIIPRKPELDNFLCKGEPLNLKKQYIVITTKIRDFNKNTFNKVLPEFLNLLKDLSKKYKIVVLGEREVEQSKEYLLYPFSMYSIYYDIINSIDKNSIIDLTVPSLGITVPNLKKIQQDCLIMKEAEFVITLGCGGNFCMAISVANTIGFRSGEKGPDILADLLDNPLYLNANIFLDWTKFISKLKEYI